MADCSGPATAEDTLAAMSRHQPFSRFGVAGSLTNTAHFKYVLASLLTSKHPVLRVTLDLSHRVNIHTNHRTANMLVSRLL
jgi:hypothetical protein